MLTLRFIQLAFVSTAFAFDFSGLKCIIIPPVADKNLGDYPRNPWLTAREIEIIQLLAEGKKNKQIATELGISARTVESHRSHIKRKLHVSSLVGLLYYAMDHGIVPQRKVG